VAPAEAVRLFPSSYLHTLPNRTIYDDSFHRQFLAAVRSGRGYLSIYLILIWTTLHQPLKVSTVTKRRPHVHGVLLRSAGGANRRWSFEPAGVYMLLLQSRMVGIALKKRKTLITDLTQNFRQRPN
jgi:hypothetical protein